MSVRPSRNGQIQTMEPIIVTVFLAMIVGVILLFYFRMADARSADESRVQENAQDLAILKRISHLPEIACPRSETGQTYCIDWYKAIAFSEGMKSQSARVAYYPLFGSSRINITVIHLDGEREQLMLYDGLGNATRVRTTITYTTVYDPSEDPSLGTRKFAMVTIERMS